MEFGDNFSATSTLRLVCFDRIVFEDDDLIGWNCLLLDTDFHQLSRLDGKVSESHKEIHVGKNNWIANGCNLLKGTVTPNNIVVAANTVLKGPIDCPEKVVIGNDHKTIILSKGKWLDRTI